METINTITIGEPFLVNSTNKVVDENQQPLFGAHVTVKGKNKGVLTNGDGVYKLNGLLSTDILLISFIGYKTKEIAANTLFLAPIQMEVDVTELDTVVITNKPKEKTSGLKIVGLIALALLAKKTFFPKNKKALNAPKYSKNVTL